MFYSTHKHIIVEMIYIALWNKVWLIQFSIVRHQDRPLMDKFRPTWKITASLSALIEDWMRFVSEYAWILFSKLHEGIVNSAHCAFHIFVSQTSHKDITVQEHFFTKVWIRLIHKFELFYSYVTRISRSTAVLKLVDIVAFVRAVQQLQR